jgi:hypothetical protein
MKSRIPVVAHRDAAAAAIRNKEARPDLKPSGNGTEKVWLVSANMGYGHLRAIFPLQSAAFEEIITLGDNDGSSIAEKKLWTKLLAVYTRFSRAKGIPGIGKYLFKILNKFLYIPSFYPIRNLSQSTFQVQMLSSFIRKGLCMGVLRKIREHPLPLVTSFYAPAIAADMNGFQSIYSVICDADLNRVWVSKEPWESTIQYFAPCGKAAQRLRAYGVPDDRIFLTGFPLPGELLGGRDLSTLRADLGQRLHHLDPGGRFWPLHGRNVEYILGETQCVPRRDRILTLTYAVGGAGAQREIGRKIAVSLRRRLRAEEIALNLVAGTSPSIREYFEEVRQEIGQDAAQHVKIVYGETFDAYYPLFNETLRRTDILWSKPSELSFYCALGIPLIISPVIGSQEYFNRKWLLEIQAGFKQENPDYTDQWLFDFLNNGRFAEAAWAGFLKARKLGTYKILDILREGKFNEDNSPLFR